MLEISISDLQEVNDYIKESERFIDLDEVVYAIEEKSHELQRDPTPKEIIDYLRDVT